MAAFLQLITAIAPIVSWIMEMVGASNEKKEKFKKLVENANRDSRIPVKHSDSFEKLDEHLDKLKPLPEEKKDGLGMGTPPKGP